MNTIEKVVAVIKYIASSDSSRGVSEISKDLKLSKNNAFRIASTLESEGWLEQHPQTKKYRLTGTLVGLGLKALTRLDIQNISLPYLQELRRVTGETSTLSLRVGLERMYINQLPSNHEIRQVVELGQHVDLWYGASGKAILAFLPETDRQIVIKQFTKSRISTLPSGQAVTAGMLKEQLEEIEKQGFVIDIGERVPGICAVAAPIIRHDGRVVGSIAISGPLPRFNLEIAKKYSSLVKSSAEKISSLLGYNV